MGLHTIQFTWNITLKEPHKITITRIGHSLTDTLEIAVDDNKIASPTVFGWTGLGFGIGTQDLAVEDRLMEIRWKYGTEDPKSIVLIDEGKIIAQYGDNRAAKSAPTSNSISHENIIPLIGPENYAYLNRHPISKWFTRRIGQFGSPGLLPISVKRGSETELPVLGQEIGFQDEALNHRLAIHNERLKKWRKTVVYMYFLIFIPAIVGLSKLLNFILDISWDYNLQNYIFFILLSYIFYGVAYAMIMKIAYWFASRTAVETLCVATILYILVELKAGDALIHTDRKQVLLARMGYLAQQTKRLARSYQSKSLSNQQWIEKHFSQMELAVREFERWIYAPIASTLTDLRNRLRELASIYISGLYGEFTYQLVDTVKPKEQSAAPTQRVALVQRLLLIFVGIVLPGALFLLIPVFPMQDEKIFGVVEPKVASAALFTLLSLGVERVFNTDSGSESVAKASAPTQAS